MLLNWVETIKIATCPLNPAPSKEVALRSHFIAHRLPFHSDWIADDGVHTTDFDIIAIAVVGPLC